jgi:transmembrane secretion effector
LRLPKTEVDLAPSHHWLEPSVASPVEHDRGPVLVQVHYHIRPEDRGAFLSTLARLSQARRGEGAYSWGVSEDAAQPAHILEWFVVDSWAEHLRQHDRVSRDDAVVQREANQFHLGPEGPRVEHYLGLATRSEST